MFYSEGQVRISMKFHLAGQIKKSTPTGLGEHQSWFMSCGDEKGAEAFLIHRRFDCYMPAAGYGV